MPNLIFVNDHRIRFPGDHILVGDSIQVEGKERTVLEYRRVGNRYFLLTVPPEMIDAERQQKILNADYQLDRERCEERTPN